MFKTLPNVGLMSLPRRDVSQHWTFRSYSLALFVIAGAMQVYLMMVCGPLFACMLAKYPCPHVGGDPQSTDIAERACDILARTQIILLSSGGVEARLNCCCCGEPNPHAAKLHINPSLPRTKACFLPSHVHVDYMCLHQPLFMPALLHPQINLQL